MKSDPLPDPSSRAALRRQLIARREAFANGPDGEAAQRALARHLAEVLDRLEPACLGLYWPVRFECNPAFALEVSPVLRATPLALPYCRREPREMHYRHWDGQLPRTQDECRLPASDGPRVRPDVLVAPCVGFTRQGYRLGYGGGYFDRYLEAHPETTVVGVCLEVGELSPSEFSPAAHDQPLLAIVTERGVVGG